MNRVIIVGRLGAKPETTIFENGQVSNLSVATNENYRGANGETVERTEWHKVVAHNRISERCDKYLDKGSLVAIEGKLQTRSYEDKNGIKHSITEVHATRVEFS